ncbi:MAG: hypothetical protein DDG58_09155 [Ardenticatenia bacterium]|nr:MAG: hypothetical protein DDG58_09155 [Ardenticatenia bacterium]
MNTKRMWALSLVLGLALGMALAVGLMQAQEPSGDEEVLAQEDVTAAAAVGWAITVQGRLLDAVGGGPVPDGNYTIRASLYDAQTGGTQLCTYSTSVSVNDGYFTTAIYNCNDADFNGQQLFLEIQVGSETLSPREAVRVVPYAATLRPGARIGGSNAGSGHLYFYDSSNRQTIHLSGGAGGLYLGTSGQDGDIVVYNSSHTATFQVDGNPGSVTQIRTGFGLVKAAIFAKCANSGSTIYRSFTMGSGVGIANGSAVGRCRLNFGFRVNDRFYTATAHGSDVNNARIVNCAWHTDQNELECRRSDAAGNGVNGDIMVVIY